MIRIYLAGEGSNDIGSWSWKEEDQGFDQFPGVLEALLQKIQPEGWQVVGGVAWKNLVKYRINTPGQAEIRNVLALAKRAKDAKCHILVFTRDRDKPKYRQRQLDIQTGIQQAEELHSGKLEIIGGIAIEKIEAWVAALQGMVRSEATIHPEKHLADRHGIESKDTAAMVALVERADLAKIPKDAISLRSWLDRAQEVFGRLVQAPAHGG